MAAAFAALAAAALALVHATVARRGPPFALGAAAAPRILHGEAAPAPAAVAEAPATQEAVVHHQASPDGDIISDVEHHQQEHEEEAHEHGGEAGEGHEHVHGHVALFFLFGGLAIGCILQFLQERYMQQVPYTCLLFVTGFGLAVLHFYRPKEHWSAWPVWYQSVEMWQYIDPHLILYIFLPALIFAEAMRLNIKLGKRLFSQVLLLACPGVVIGGVLTAAFSRYVFPYGWTWATCLVFGSILAATDPVAVVALFNTLGVSPRLTMLISGESLLNDGTAIVCFTLLMKLQEGQAITAAGALLFFLRMTVVAVVLGVAVAACGLVLIFGSAETRYHSDAMIQVAVTVCCGFLCFFLAESEVSTSGVLAVVSAGSMFAYLAWPRFVSREIMHTVWEFIEFIGNTVIFLLAGLLFGHRVLSRRDQAHLNVGDLGYLLLLYIGVTVIRAIMVGVLWPLLNCCGQRVTWQEATIMVWSGLRGAVGLVLAIVVDRETGENSQVGSRIMFHVGGIAMLTILVNATLAAPILRRLGLTKTPEIEEQSIAHFERETDEHARVVLKQLLEKSDDPRFTGASLETVRGLVPALSDGGPSPRDEGADANQRHMQARLRTYREIFMRVVQRHYWEDIESGLIPRTSRVARILLYSTDEALDNSKSSLRDWEVVEETLDEHQVLPCVDAIASTWPLSSCVWLQELTPSAATMKTWQAYAALSYIEAHKAARAEVPEHFGEVSVLGRRVQELVATESFAQTERAEATLARLPEAAVESCKSRMLAGRVLALQVEKVASLQESGLLSEKGAAHIMHRLQDAQRHVAAASHGSDPDPFGSALCGDTEDSGSSSAGESLLS